MLVHTLCMHVLCVRAVILLSAECTVVQFYGRSRLVASHATNYSARAQVLRVMHALTCTTHYLLHGPYSLYVGVRVVGDVVYQHTHVLLLVTHEWISCYSEDQRSTQSIYTHRVVHSTCYYM